MPRSLEFRYNPTGMIARLHSVAFDGIDAIPVEVEVDVAKRGFAGTAIVGLPDAAVKESIERVRASMGNSGYSFPRYKTVINLAPADLRKEGPLFDLPIAVGVISANGDIVPELAADYLMVGELALDGRVRCVRGALSAAMLARERGLRGIILPAENAPEAAVVNDVDVIPVAHLTEAVGFLSNQLPIEPVVVDLAAIFERAGRYDCDFADVRGQEQVKRAMIIAAAGSHNMLLIGPPGSGKTMLAKRFPTILPQLGLQEALDTTRVHSVSGELKPGTPLLALRPVRAPHHSASTPALVGGGTIPQAGEVSLAHHGVLFLDEFPEFSRQTLEALRQPLEEGEVTIARSHSTTRFPASFVLLAAMNPCPCGYYTDPRRPCKCTSPQIDKYLARISGPLVDRIDIHIEVPAVALNELRSEQDGTPSSAMRKQVLSARAIQTARFNNKPGMTNGRLSGKALRAHCRLDAGGERILQQSMSELGLSARAHDKVLRLARTIADLAAIDPGAIDANRTATDVPNDDNALPIQADHVAEAIHYRRLDRQL